MAKEKVLSQMAVLAIVEANSGTYEEPTQVVPAQKSGIWDIEVDKDEIDPLSAYQGSKRTDIITDFANVPIALEGRLPDSKDLIDVLLRGCGLVGVTDGNVTTYRYNTSDNKTLSLKQVAKRETTQVNGARGSFKISAKAGEAVKITFDFKSNLKDVVELASDAADNTIPDLADFGSVFMTKACDAYLLNANNASLKEFEFDLKADVIATKETCPGGCYTKDTKPEVTLKMSVTPDNEGAFSDLKSGKEFNLVVPFFDINGIKRWEFHSPKLVVIDNKKPDEDGVLNVDRTLECRKVAGDDNFELKYFA